MSCRIINTTNYCAAVALASVLDHCCWSLIKHRLFGSICQLPAVWCTVSSWSRNKKSRCVYSFLYHDVNCNWIAVHWYSIPITKCTAICFFHSTVIPGGDSVHLRVFMTCQQRSAEVWYNIFAFRCLAFGIWCLVVVVVVYQTRPLYGNNWLIAMCVHVAWAKTHHWSVGWSSFFFRCFQFHCGRRLPLGNRRQVNTDTGTQHTQKETLATKSNYAKGRTVSITH